MLSHTKRNALTLFRFFLLLSLVFIAIPPLFAADADMQEAFWARAWGRMDAIYQSTSADVTALSSQDRSLYVNALWMQGKYEDGLKLLDALSADLPGELHPYAHMFFVLGQERTGGKEKAYEAGRALWETAPQPLRYYLAYALGRLARDLGVAEESLGWFREMSKLAPDKKRRVQALNQMIELPGVTGDEAATLLIDLPSSSRALEICRALPRGSSSRAEYALGYNAYINKRYDAAVSHFRLASADVDYGEAAKYYHAYAAYRQNKDDTALALWSNVALSGNDYPQRSIARLTTLSGRGKKSAVLETFKKVAATRDDYPALAADALVGVIRLGKGREVADAEAALFAKFKASNQAAIARWEKGWSAWKAENYAVAQEQWAAGADSEIPNKELGARLMYWRMRALEKLGSPVAAGRVRDELVAAYPAEYHTFMASPGGGIVSADIPERYRSTSLLEEWGFVTYARLEAAAVSGDKPDPATLYRAVRLALWEGDYSSAVRSFGVLQRSIPAADYAASALLKGYFPRAFETDVTAASRRTGVEPPIIWAVMRQESLYEPDVTSTAGAYGLMQLMPATAKSEATKMKLAENAYREPAGNILLGANHLVGLFARFKQMPLALAAYNAGGSPVTRWSKNPIDDMPAWVEDIGYPETRGYVKAVLRNIDVYRILYPK